MIGCVPFLTNPPLTTNSSWAASQMKRWLSLQAPIDKCTAVFVLHIFVDRVDIVKELAFGSAYTSSKERAHSVGVRIILEGEHASTSGWSFSFLVQFTEKNSHCRREGNEKVIFYTRRHPRQTNATNFWGDVFVSLEEKANHPNSGIPANF
jgi:hypothetical protein